MLVYAVTDRAWVGKMSLYEQVEASLQNGATCIQLREKELDDDSFLKEAIELAALCRRYGVPFIVNDNVEIAIACHADGVHVGQQDMKASDVRKKVGENMIIGVSAHTVEEAVEAVKQGADYLGLGAVFSTSTKTDADTMSYETLKAIGGDSNRGHWRDLCRQYYEAERERRRRCCCGIRHFWRTGSRQRHCPAGRAGQTNDCGMIFYEPDYII